MIQRDGDSRILIGLILIVAFALRLGAAYWWESRLTEGQQFAFGDSAHCQQIVRTDLAAGIDSAVVSPQGASAELYARCAQAFSRDEFICTSGAVGDTAHFSTH